MVATSEELVAHARTVRDQAKGLSRRWWERQLRKRSEESTYGGQVRESEGALADLRDEKSAFLDERSDDPEEDYALLLAKTESLFANFAEAVASGSDDEVMIRDSMAWRGCRKMAALHYEFFDGTLLELRKEAKGSDGPSECDEALERAIEESDLAGVVERLHEDCFGGPGE